mmetsp:Transcript_103858/g.252141  ORF Transcript_103858/g.252141 Transcript_103858/m.252141 type:complete len:378 (-) Transcript_103858:173-1306(-)
MARPGSAEPPAATGIAVMEPPSRRGHFSKRMKTALAVACFAWVGMALRLGLAKLTADLNFGITTSTDLHTEQCIRRASAHGFFLQNMLGCFLIAVVARHRPLLNEHVAAGLSTGLCGSLTTWGTWMQETASTMLHGDVWMAFVSLFAMLSLSLSSLSLGQVAANGGMDVTPSIPIRMHFSHKAAPAAAHRFAEDEAGSDAVRAAEEEEDWALELSEPPASREPSAKEPDATRLHTLIIGGAAVLVVLAVALLSICRDLEGLLCMAMAPPGALLRWLLALGNPYTAPLPVFTLAANTLACGVEAVSAVMAGRAPSGLGRDAWAALGTGFAGCLSTVSTFAVELCTDKLGGLRMRATYFLISFALAMATLLPPYALARC